MYLSQREAMKNKGKGIFGEYSALHYVIYEVGKNGNVEPIYEAGNSPFDSHVYVSAEDGEGIETMKQFCEHTAKEIAEERRIKYLGITKEEVEEDE